jgi:hypothetical protein
VANKPNALEQYRHGMFASAIGLTLREFLASLRCTAASLLDSSHAAVPAHYVMNNEEKEKLTLTGTKAIFPYTFLASNSSSSLRLLDSFLCASTTFGIISFFIFANLFTPNNIILKAVVICDCSLKLERSLKSQD